MYKIHQVPTQFQPGEEVLFYDAKKDAMFRGVVIATYAALSVKMPDHTPEWAIEYRVAFAGGEELMPEGALTRHDRWAIEFPPRDPAGEPAVL